MFDLRKRAHQKIKDGDLAVTSDYYPDDRVYIPHWMAERIREKYGSLEAYREITGANVVDDYWQQLNSESQARINEKLRLIRGWRMVSETKVMYQKRMRTPDA